MLINVFLVLSSMLIVYLDLKYRKIFNIITYPLIAAAIIINVYIFGLIGLLYSLAGFTAGILAWYIAYKLSFSNYGEFKFLALIGILKGYYFVFFVGFISYALIFLSHMIYLLTCRSMKIVIQNSKIYIDLILQYGISIWTIIDEDIEKLIVSYSLIIFLSIFIGLGLGI